MSKFIIVALMWLIGSNSFAITTPFKTKKLKVICATKGKKKKYYKIGEGVAIWVKQKDSVVKIKGFINNTYGDSVEIGSFKKRKQTFISIHINRYRSKAAFLCWCWCIKFNFYSTINFNRQKHR
jgi:hypothetical protein